MALVWPASSAKLPQFHPATAADLAVMFISVPLSPLGTGSHAAVSSTAGRLICLLRGRGEPLPGHAAPAAGRVGVRRGRVASLLPRSRQPQSCAHEAIGAASQPQPCSLWGLAGLGCGGCTCPDASGPAPVAVPSSLGGRSPGGRPLVFSEFLPLVAGKRPRPLPGLPETHSCQRSLCHPLFSSSLGQTGVFSVTGLWPW